MQNLGLTPDGEKLLLEFVHSFMSEPLFGRAPSKKQATESHKS